MSKLIRFFKRHLFPHTERGEKSAEELRAAFGKRYKNFRALLTANNNALEIMADMEQTLSGGQTFSMAFVRANTTAMIVNVYKMVQNLSEMSDGKYRSLEKVFREITPRIEDVLEREPAIRRARTGESILPLSQIDKGKADQAGEKMANLGEVRNRVGLKVPPGFAITAAAAQHFVSINNLQEEINRQLQTLDTNDLEVLYRTSANIQKLITNALLPPDLEEAIHEHYNRLEKETHRDVMVSMRSSALGEDTRNVSFAGQYRTQLNVSREFLSQTYKEIIAGKYRSQAIIYRLQRGFRDEDIVMCVGCLAMVDAVVSGVTYSRSPADPRSPWVVISAIRGLAKSVVDGTSAAYVVRVARDRPYNILKRQRGSKQENAPKSKKEQDHPEEGSASANQETILTDEQAQDLARIAVRLEKHFGTPQDIEWSIDTAGEIVILQSRPFAKHPEAERSHDADAEKALYSGTPPLLAGGVTASAGAACGPVHVVRSNVDLLQFPTGAVLVVVHPVPDWATLLNRAVAVVSETGEVAAHLATVSREFGIPALFGVEKATEKLKDGDFITVDATSRRIYAGRETALLTQPVKPPNLMEGSPIQQVFKDILKFVTPLNLTNPGSPYFRPSECKTLHDITRFCHEKAVLEMFNFGKEYSFDERAAKRLVGETPSQWWVIDLSDGFREGIDATGNMLNISDVVSLPMLAIWDGITAIPWQGPPPVSFKGFGSVLFQSTMNPNLEPAVRSHMTAKNYFLVSKNFCNLSVRLGYHFSMVEAYLSDLLTESYVSFNFKGGAADERRRQLRLNLIAEILEKHDFRVQLKADTLTARVEKRPKAYLLKRLKILGYLIMHTRQIDMIMDDYAVVRGYRNKIFSDITAIMTDETPKNAREERVNGNEIQSSARR